MSHRRLRAAQACVGVLLASLPALPGCGDCNERRIDVGLPARLVVDGQDSAVVLTGRVTDTNIDRAAYDTLARIVSDAGQVAPEQMIIWTLDQGLGATGFLGLQLLVPVSRGATVPVILGSPGGWGVQTVSRPPPPPPAVVGFTRGDFTATSVTGTATVQETSPLRLAVDLTFRNAAGRTVRLDGVMQFTVFSLSVPCID